MMSEINIDEKLLAELLQRLQKPKQEQIEYRLYYDSNGRVITYSTENLPGKYLVITREQFSEARSDVIVQNNVIVQTHLKNTVHKLKKNKVSRVCSKYDVSIIIDTDVSEWKMVSYDITGKNN